MSPNQFQNNNNSATGVHNTSTSPGVSFTTRTTPNNPEEDDNDRFLVTDCPNYKTDHRLPQVLVTGADQLTKHRLVASSPSSIRSDDITIQSIRGHSDDNDDDASSVVTDSSVSDYEEGGCNRVFKESANSLAIDAINCCSESLRPDVGSALRVNSEIRAGPNNIESRLDVVHGNGQTNNGFTVSEMDRPRSRSDIIPAKSQVAVANGGSPAALVTATGHTTAIFNDSTDITLGNKTFITGSLTIKQYIKDGSGGGGGGGQSKQAVYSMYIYIISDKNFYCGEL